MIYREYRSSRHSKARQLVIEIHYREYDRKISYIGGLLFERKDPKEIGSLKKVVNNLPVLLPNISSLNVLPLFGYDLAEVNRGITPMRMKSKVSYNPNDYIYDL